MTKDKWASRHRLNIHMTLVPLTDKKYKIMKNLVDSNGCSEGMSGTIWSSPPHY